MRSILDATRNLPGMADGPQVDMGFPMLKRPAAAMRGSFPFQRL